MLTLMLSMLSGWFMDGHLGENLGELEGQEETVTKGPTQRTITRASEGVKTPLMEQNLSKINGIRFPPI